MTNKPTTKQAVKQTTSPAPILAMDLVMQLIGGKYKCWILYYLSGGAIRTGELLRLIASKTNHNISQKVLTEQLRQLEQDGLILRKVYPEVPPRVEYTLSELGLTFIPVLKTLCLWGKEYADNQAIEIGTCTVFL